MTVKSGLVVGGLITPALVGGISGGGGSNLFPILEGTAVSAETALVNTHTVNLPANLVSGQMLVLFMVFVGEPGATTSTPSGWTIITDIANWSVYYKVSDGLEGETVEVTSSGASGEFSASCSMSFSNYQGIPASSSAVSTSSFPDSPELTPSWGAVPQLYFSIAGTYDAFNNSFATYPSGYTGGVTVNSDFDGGDDDLNAAMAFLEASTSPENPGEFGMNSEDASFWWAATMSLQGP